jgi:hypothetical protein
MRSGRLNQLLERVCDLRHLGLPQRLKMMPPTEKGLIGPGLESRFEERKPRHN